MIPFLILSMVDIILSGTVGIVVVVALFHIHIIHGVVSLAVYLVICTYTTELQTKISQSWRRPLLSWLNAPISAFTFNTLLSHYAK